MGDAFVVFVESELRYQLIEVLPILVYDHLHLVNPVFIGKDEQAEKQNQRFLQFVLGLVVDRRGLHHYVFQIIFVINEVRCKLEVVHAFVVIVVALLCLAIGMLLANVDDALVQSRVQQVVLNFHAMALEGVGVALAHLKEDLVEPLVYVIGKSCVLVHPPHKTVKFLEVLLQSFS